MTVDRSITVPSDYYGEHDAVLTLTSPDGEAGTMTLTVDDCTIACGEDFRAPSFGPSLLEMTDERLACMFGSFLDHALESGEDGAQDGWTYLSDDASSWTDALISMEEEA